MATWIREIEHALAQNDEKLSDMEMCTLTATQLCIDFDTGYGRIEGKAFTAWTKNFVYFPAQYDGKEWVESVPRNPNGAATPHIGG